MTTVRGVALALLAGLCLAPAPAAWPATEEKKVWRALTEGEPRSPQSAARPAAPAPRRSPEAFPSELVLGLAVAGVIAAILAAGALQGRRKPVPPEARAPAEPEEGSPLERLWRAHLRGKRPKPGPGV